MLPWQAITLAVTQTLSSRVVIDGVEINPDVAQRIIDGIDYVEEWVDLFKDLDVSKPQSVASFIVDMSRAIVEENTKKKVDSVFKDMAKDERFMVPDDIQWIIDEALTRMEFGIYGESVDEEEDSTKVEIVKEYGNDLLVEMPLSGEHSIHYIARNGDLSNMDVLFMPGDANDGFQKAVRDIIWGDTEILLLSYGGDYPYTSEVEFDKPEYRGSKTEYIDEWQRQVEQGKSRTILLQGVPGTGKTTFASHVRKKMSKRTLMISHDMLKNMSQIQWQNTLFWLEPDMVFVDDIDRVSDWMNSCLYLFEDSHYSVPITLLTSNNFLSLPSAARRCGRIDQILAMKPPTDEVQRDQIIQFAVEEGLIESEEQASEIPQDTMLFLTEVHHAYAGAGTREVAFRMSVHGFDYRPKEDDITFAKVTGNMDDSLFESDEEYYGGSGEVQSEDSKTLTAHKSYVRAGNRTDKMKSLLGKPKS